MNTEIGQETMKFIVNGRTFDTATSSKVAVSRGIDSPNYNNFPGDSERRYEDILYRTAKGAFFVHSHATEKLVKGGRPIVTDQACEFEGDAVVVWIADNEAAVIDATGLPLPPEA